MASTACLVVHGFGGTPFEVLPVAEALEKEGFAVSAPTLPGHGSTVEHWNRTGWGDWLGHVTAEYDRLARDHGRVFAIGLSMGGSLCLALAEGRNPAGVVTIASPVYLYRFLPPEATDWRIPFTPIIRRFRPIWPVPPKKPESRAIAPWQGYEGAVSMNALHSFLEGLREVRRGLGKITAPILAIHSPLDRHVPAGNVREILERAGSTVKRSVMLPITETVTKHHLLTTHRETREEVARLCVEFVRETVGR